jgi:heme-degrading monooxygenase HmoA
VGCEEHEDGCMSEEQDVVRIWRGVIRTENRDEYVDYVERTGIKDYRSVPGNRDAWTLTRELPGGLTEVLTVSRWDNLESIRAFAGDDIEKAVYYPEDDRFLVERDDAVRLFVQRS